MSKAKKHVKIIFVNFLKIFQAIFVRNVFSYSGKYVKSYKIISLRVSRASYAKQIIFLSN